MIPHTVTDPTCLYYAGPSLDYRPRWRDWLRHPLVCREWYRHEKARGRQCFACNPPKNEAFWITFLPTKETP